MKIKWLIVFVLAVLVVPMSGQVVSHPIAEDWESGDFSSLSWERPGLQYRWEITSEGAPTAAFGVLNFPNLGSPMAFVVLDDYLLAGNQYNTTAHSGHRFLGSPFHSDISNDDWIVSPELDFTEPFTFLFFARSFADRFADEKFIAAYSMTDTNANSFIPLHCDSITTIAEWNEYSFLVPAAAKYVAVHCVSHDQYMFCLDDLSIRGRKTSGHLCNVYRDGMLIVSGVTDSVYVDSLASAGEHCYSITYSCGDMESAHSDTVCVHLNAAPAAVTPEERDALPYELPSESKDVSNSHMADSVDLYICPLENPDGTYYLTNDLILKDGIHSIYHNYNDVQLNRNYPYLPGLEGAANIQPETQAIIDWVTPIHFVMSVNLHCGAEIVNYPWDAWTTQQRAHADADWFRYTGQNYASLCHAQDTAYLYGDYRGRSVIEGADWSPLVGGRQDYMTYYQRCREVTIEMSHIPVITDTLLLPTYWDKNKDALLSYAVESSYGFWGVVTDAETHEPIEAQVKVLNHDRFHSEVYSHLPLGVYHRPIMAGTYTVEVSAPCYQTATFNVTTRPGVGIRHDVELQPQVEAPVAFDQYILPGMQTTVVALAQNEVHWYDSDTASQAIAVGDYFTTPVLYDTTTYYLEEQFQDDTLLCTSSRSSVTVYILGNTSVSEYNEDSMLKIFPNPTGDFLTIDVGGEPLRAVSVYDAEGKQVLTKRVSVSGVLDVTSIKPGSYLLRVEYADGRWCWVKFVKSGER